MRRNLRAVPLTCSLVLAAAIAAPGAGEATLFALRNPGDGGRQLVVLDPATGGATPVSGSISPPLPSASGVNALDAGGERFFFIATPTGETEARLYTVDTQTGAVLGSPTVTGGGTVFIDALEYDPDEDLLFALRNPGDGGRQLVILDPVTGSVTPVGAGVALSGMASGLSALDAAGDRIFFVATAPAETGSRVYTLDTATGALLASPAVAGSATAPMQSLEYDQAEGVLFALRNPGDLGRQLTELDPATGAVTPLGASISPPLGTASGVAALDEAGDRFFFAGSVSGEAFWRLFTVDTGTGTVLSSPPIDDTDIGFVNGMAFAAEAPPVATVTIDVKPGSATNPINVHSKGVIPVAILTTPSFDATTVDPSTVAFGPGGAAEAHGTGHLEDVDGDGDVDLMLHFRTQEAAIPCGSTSASLIGLTYDAQPITGSDAVSLVGCP